MALPPNGTGFTETAALSAAVRFGCEVDVLPTPTCGDPAAPPAAPPFVEGGGGLVPGPVGVDEPHDERKRIATTTVSRQGSPTALKIMAEGYHAVARHP